MTHFTEICKDIKKEIVTDCCISAPVVDLILDLSGHKEVENQWILMTRKLRQFAFTMQPGHSIEEIREFERRIKKELPWDMRISLMMCAFINVPCIFQDSSHFERISDPLQSEYVTNPVDDYREKHSKFISYSIDFDGLMEGVDGKDWFDDDNFKNVMRITTIEIADICGANESLIDIYWNTVNNEIMVINVGSQNFEKYRFFDADKYDSWTHFLKSSTQKYIEKQQEIGSLYNHKGLAVEFVEAVEILHPESLVGDDMCFIEQALDDYTGAYCDEKTMLKIVDIFRNEQE